MHSVCDKQRQQRGARHVLVARLAVSRCQSNQIFTAHNSQNVCKGNKSATTIVWQPSLHPTAERVPLQQIFAAGRYQDTVFLMVYSYDAVRRALKRIRDLIQDKNRVSKCYLFRRFLVVDCPATRLPTSTCYSYVYFTGIQAQSCRSNGAGGSRVSRNTSQTRRSG